MSSQITTPQLINIQDDTFYFSVFLVNSDKRVFLLRPDAIKQLIIEDDFTNYYQSGYIIIDNKFDAIEQPSQVIDKNSELNTNGYIFKGGARDILRIEIMPKLTQNSLGTDIDDTTNKFFRLSYEFIVYNIEEYLGDEPGEKYKKLFFHDIYHQLLSEKNIQFSSAEMINLSSTNNLNNNDRSQYTGDIIKYIIDKSLNKEDNLNTNFGVFDIGSTKVFFSSPTNYKVEDCINYILNRHVSSKANNYDQCFLRLNRYPKQWELVSLSDIFKTAYNTNTDTGGVNFLEKILLGGYGSGDTGTNFTAVIERSPKLSLYLPKYGTLDNFTFLPTAGYETQITTNNKAVHNYNFTEGSFTIDAQLNDYTSMKDIFYDNYVKPMKGEKNKPINSIIDNYYRSSRKNIDSIYSTTEDSAIQRLGISRNVFLSNSLFLNSCISFRVKGASYRQAGCFISIDRNNAITDNDFDNKLLGIYFIVNVKHIFAQNVYYNDLLCIKTYLYKDINNLPSIV